MDTPETCSLAEMVKGPFTLTPFGVVRLRDGRTVSIVKPPVSFAAGSTFPLMSTGETRQM